MCWYMQYKILRFSYTAENFSSVSQATSWSNWYTIFAFLITRHNWSIYNMFDIFGLLSCCFYYEIDYPMCSTNNRYSENVFIKAITSWQKWSTSLTSPVYVLVTGSCLEWSFSHAQPSVVHVYFSLSLDVLSFSNFPKSCLQSSPFP